MDPGDQRITLDDFSLWKIEALRSFLSCRGLSTTGGGGPHVHLAVPKWHECTSHNPDFHFFNLLSPLLQPLTQQCLPGMYMFSLN